MKYLVGMFLSFCSIVSFLAMLLLVGGTFYAAVFQPEFDSYGRQIALMVASLAIWAVAGLFGRILKADSH